MGSILLLGDLVLDKGYHGSANSLSPEGPYPVIDVETTSLTLGGIGNVIGSVVDFFEATHFITCLRSEDAALVQEQLGRKVKYHNVNQADRALVTINRVLVGNYCVARFDQNATSTSCISQTNETAILRYIEEIIERLDIVILSDYNRGSLPPAVCRSVIELCNKNGVKTLVDPKMPAWEKFRGATLIKPNREEAVAFFGKPINHKTAANFGQTMLVDLEIPYILNTLDKEGMVLYFHDEWDNVNNMRMIQKLPLDSDVVDVIGCGDVVIATIAVYLLHYGSLRYRENDLLNVLTRAGSIAVGAQGCYILNTQDWSKNILCQKKIVFTNGCFDIIHCGHVRLLKYCRTQGDYLIIGLNTDESIQRLKGTSRPINKLEDRIKFLQELNIADEIVSFAEDTPFKLIKRIEPDVLVKGGDYLIEQVVGREFAKKTVLFPLVEGYSSSRIIETATVLFAKHQFGKH